MGARTIRLATFTIRAFIGNSMRLLKTNRLYCFSPPVMIATFVIELVCALYILFRYHLTPVSRIAVFVLFGLAIFQLAEYNICETAWGIDSLSWARVGHVAITLLPPLGLHLATKLAGQRKPLLVGLAYASATIFSCIFLFVGHGLTSQQCLGNYVIFDMASWAIWPYTIYYYGWLFVTVGYAIKVASWHKQSAIRKALYVLAIGYLTFVVPTTAVNIIDPSTLAGIPSIMCGFAVILALMLTIGTVPLYYTTIKTPRQ